MEDIRNYLTFPIFRFINFVLSVLFLIKWHIFSKSSVVHIALG